MYLVWRGAGLIVPVVFVAAAGIVGKWFTDTRLGNTPYLGWTCFYSALVCLIIGLFITAGRKKGSIKRKHDFFFVPVIIWAIIFGGTSLYLLVF